MDPTSAGIVTGAAVALISVAVTGIAGLAIENMRGNREDRADKKKREWYREDRKREALYALQDVIAEAMTSEDTTYRAMAIRYAATFQSMRVGDDILHELTSEWANQLIILTRDFNTSAQQRSMELADHRAKTQYASDDLTHRIGELLNPVV